MRCQGHQTADKVVTQLFHLAWKDGDGDDNDYDGDDVGGDGGDGDGGVIDYYDGCVYDYSSGDYCNGDDDGDCGPGISTVCLRLGA